MPENWCFWIVMEKTLENALDSKEIKPVNPKRNQPWIFIGRTNAEAEAPILWIPDVKSQLTGKDPNAGKDWGQGEKGVTEDEMFGWYHWPNGHELEHIWETVKDREAWRAAVHGVVGSWTQLSDWTTRQMHCAEGRITGCPNLESLGFLGWFWENEPWKVISPAAAAAAAKLLRLCPTLCNPIDGSPPGSPVPGILQARTLEWVALA